MTVAPAPVGYVPLTFQLQARETMPELGIDVRADIWIPTGMENVPSHATLSGTMLGEPVSETITGEVSPAERTALTAFAQSLAGVDLLQHATAHQPGADLVPGEERVVFAGPQEAAQGGLMDMFTMPLATFQANFAPQFQLLEAYVEAALPESLDTLAS